MSVNKSFSLCLLTLFTLTDYSNAAISLGVLKRRDTNDLSKSLDSFYQDLEVTDTNDRKAKALDSALSAAATEIVEDQEKLDEFITSTCSLLQPDFAKCDVLVKGYLTHCSANDYQCTQISPIRLTNVGIYNLNTFELAQLTSSIILFNKVQSQKKIFSKSNLKHISLKILSLGFYNYNYTQSTLYKSLLRKLKSGVVVTQYTEDLDASDLKSQVLALGFESLVSSFAVFFRVLSASVINANNTKGFNVLHMALNNDNVFRLYTLYFKNIKKLGRVITKSSKGLFKNMEYSSILMFIKNFQYSLPAYLSFMAPGMSEHQLEKVTQLFLDILQNGAIDVSNIDESEIPMDTATQNAVDMICKNASGEKITIRKCLNSRKERQELKSRLSAITYNNLKALAKVEERSTQGQRKNLLRSGYSNMMKFFKKRLGKQNED